jgi:hypothetical protein
MALLRGGSRCWRVAFYGISAFGTDKYPPFSLQPDPSYPADFSVDYPQQLSRGLVLVKWRLLALPQYLIVAIFAGGWGLNRWCYRVLAYAALMRDEYPPFRLDTGGTDPGHATRPPAGPPAPQPAAAGSSS